jgi:hypothetical protein
MRKIILTGAIASIVIGNLMPFNMQQSSAIGRSSNILQASITGKISPADGAEVVWAISATDSVKAMVALGSFSIQVKPGLYKLIVDAKEPLKDAQLDNLDVKENQVLDVGEIILQK